MMKQQWLILFLVGMSYFVAKAQDSVSTEAKYSVVIIPISGNVDPGMAAFIGRAVRTQASENDSKVLYIIEMDTFGGRVDAALQIVDTLSTIPSEKTFAYVTKRAISAGSLIALACGRLFMQHNTTIGDCAPITFSNEGPKMLGEKFQSPLRAKFRALAKRNNYPVVLAQSMVSIDMIVYKLEFPDTIMYVDSSGYEDLTTKEKERIVKKTTIVKRGELLTMDNQEAVELGFSSQSVSDVEEILTFLDIKDYEIIRIEENWSEVFVRFIGTIAPILLMIGFAALYTELKAPGFGLPGIIGIICLALVFGAQYMVGLADHTELLLIIIGITLLGLELFVLPGFGIIGIAGMALIAVGMVLSLQDFVIPKPDMPWQRELIQKNIAMMVISLIGSLILIILFFRYAFPRLSQLISGPYLASQLTGSQMNTEALGGLSVNDRGIVTKTLRPSGIAQFGETIFDVVTEGDFIEKGETVMVTEIQGNRIVVIKYVNEIPPPENQIQGNTDND